MSLKKNPIYKLLTTALDHAARRHGTSSESEFRAIDATELLSMLQLDASIQDALTNGTADRLEGRDRERAQAVVVVCTIEAGGHPYQVITESIRRVIKRLEMVTREREQSERAAIHESPQMSRYHAAIKLDLDAAFGRREKLAG